MLTQKVRIPYHPVSHLILKETVPRQLEQPLMPKETALQPVLCTHMQKVWELPQGVQQLMLKVFLVLPAVRGVTQKVQIPRLLVIQLMLKVLIQRQMLTFLMPEVRVQLQMVYLRQ